MNSFNLTDRPVPRLEIDQAKRRGQPAATGPDSSLSLVVSLPTMLGFRQELGGGLLVMAAGSMIGTFIGGQRQPSRQGP